MNTPIQPNPTAISLALTGLPDNTRFVTLGWSDDGHTVTLRPGLPPVDDENTLAIDLHARPGETREDIQEFLEPDLSAKWDMPTYWT